MNGSTSELVTLSAVGNCAVVSLERLDARNALNAELWLQLTEILGRIDAEPPCRGLVLTGQGSYFSAGGDLKSKPAYGAKAIAPIGRLEIAHQALDRLRSLSVPTIAAVEGGAAGLGWSLALTCDIVIAAEDATFVAPFVKRGVCPDGGMAWLLVRHLGRFRAADILFSGRSVEAAEALATGLVSKIVPAGKTRAEALSTLNDLGDNPRAIELTKRLLRVAESSEFDGFREAEILAGVICQKGNEAGQSRAAFNKDTGE